MSKHAFHGRASAHPAFFANNSAAANTITQDYSQLIEFKLRRTFRSMRLHRDFKNPQGFAELSQASRAVQYYFHVRRQLEFFIVKDIFQHKRNIKTRTKAFSHWIEVASNLFDSGFYEGYHLVILKLQQVEKPNLLKGLSESHQQKYEDMCLLSQRNAPLSNLINRDKNDKKLKPVPLLSLSLTAIKEHLAEDWSKPLTGFSEKHENYCLAKRRDELFDEIKTAHHVRAGNLPDHLTQLSSQIKEDYNNREFKHYKLLSPEVFNTKQDSAIISFLRRGCDTLRRSSAAPRI